MRKKIEKYRDIILLTIGTMLIILSLCLLFYDRFELLRLEIFDEIEIEKYRENNNDIETITNNESYIENVETDDIVDEEIQEETEETPQVTNNPSQTNKTSSYINKIKKEFIGYLEIKKINLKQGLVSMNSYYNNVKYNIQMIETSDYPDKNMGNVILAGHSGSGYLAFFKNLYKLNLGDEAKIYYKGYVYTYKIVNIYNVPKTGQIKINRNVLKTCLTLITCTHNSKTEQTVYILELTSKVKEGGK